MANLESWPYLHFIERHRGVLHQPRWTFSLGDQRSINSPTMDACDSIQSSTRLRRPRGLDWQSIWARLPRLAYAWSFQTGQHPLCSELNRRLAVPTNVPTQFILVSFEPTSRYVPIAKPCTSKSNKPSLKTIPRGTATQCLVACHPDLEGVGGEFQRLSNRRHHSQGQDDALAAELEKQRKLFRDLDKIIGTMTWTSYPKIIKPPPIDKSASTVGGLSSPSSLSVPTTMFTEYHLHAVALPLKYCVYVHRGRRSLIPPLLRSLKVSHPRWPLNPKVHPNSTTPNATIKSPKTNQQHPNKTPNSRMRLAMDSKNILRTKTP